MKDYKKTLLEIKKINPKYIAVSSLFWEGLIDFNIKANFLKSKSYKREIESYNYYNIYSIYNYIEFLKKLGYKKNIIKKFDIKKRLKEPSNKNKMGTYTIPYKKIKANIWTNYSKLVFYNFTKKIIIQSDYCIEYIFNIMKPKESIFN